MTLAPRKFSGEKWPRNRAVGDAFEGKADAGPIEDSGLTADPFTLLGNPRLDEQPVTPLTVVGEVEFNSDDNSIHFLADARKSLGLGQFAATTSEALLDVMSDETGTGLLVFNTAPEFTSPSVTDTIYKNSFSVFPFINAQSDYGVTGDGATDDLAALNAAIQAFNISGGTLILPAGVIRLTSPPAQITVSGGRIVGQGPSRTYISAAYASGRVLEFNGAQQTSLEHVSFQPSVHRTDGYDLVVRRGYRNLFKNIRHAYGCHGIYVEACATPVFENITMLQMFGHSGFYLTGTDAANSTFGISLHNCLFNNPLPLPYGAYRAFGFTTVFTAGEMTDNNGYVWQCTVTGTTAGAGTLTPPSSSLGAWTTTNVVHGSAEFRCIGFFGLAWVRMESFSNSLTLNTVGMINGTFGFLMADTVNSTSSPSYVHATDLECDHQYFSGVACVAGQSFNLENSRIISSIRQHGCQFTTSWSGEVIISGSDINFNGAAGIFVTAGTEIHINDNMILANSALSHGTNSGVEFAANTGKFSVTGNTFGSRAGAGINWMANGVLVNAGTSDDYIITDNTGFHLNNTYCVNDGGAGLNKVVRDNTPLQPTANPLVVVTAATHTVANTTDVIRCDRAAGTITLTLPNPDTFEGRELVIYTIQNQTVVSATGNVGPLVGGGASTAILAATAGKWARLKANAGDDIWYIIGAN